MSETLAFSDSALPEIFSEYGLVGGKNAEVGHWAESLPSGTSIALWPSIHFLNEWIALLRIGRTRLTRFLRLS